MNRNRLIRMALIPALLLIGVFIYFAAIGKAEAARPLLVLGFVTVAIASRGIPRLRSITYSFWILTALSVSMSYPQWFLGIGDFKFKQLIVPLLQIIMFGMGSQMSLQDFVGVIKMPKGVVVGLLCQFSIMPIMGYLVAKTFGFPPEIAAGIVLVGSSPSGLASNVMAFLARANLALSITLTAVATLLAPLMTPFLMKVFAGELVEVQYLKMMVSIFNMVILPICAGLTFSLFANGGTSHRHKALQLASFSAVILLKNMMGLQAAGGGWAELGSGMLKDVFFFSLLPVVLAFLFRWLAKGRKEVLEKILSFVSMAGIAVIITVITAAGRDSLLQIGILLMAACFVHNIFGYTLGYLFARLLRMKEKDCRTIAIEVGMQNGGLASGLALEMGKVATVGLAPAIFGPMMNITGSSLATWWRGRPLKDSEPPEDHAEAATTSEMEV